MVRALKRAPHAVGDITGETAELPASDTRGTNQSFKGHVSPVLGHFCVIVAGGFASTRHAVVLSPHTNGRTNAARPPNKGFGKM